MRLDVLLAEILHPGLELFKAEMESVDLDMNAFKFLLQLSLGLRDVGVDSAHQILAVKAAFVLLIVDFIQNWAHSTLVYDAASSQFG